MKIQILWEILCFLQQLDKSALSSILSYPDYGTGEKSSQPKLYFYLKLGYASNYGCGSQTEEALAAGTHQRKKPLVVVQPLCVSESDYGFARNMEMAAS